VFLLSGRVWLEQERLKQHSANSAKYKWRNGTMTTTPAQNISAEYLRSAQPRLICRVDIEEGRRCKLTPYISEVERGWDEIIREGYDPDHSPLGCPVYWRVINRGEEQFYCSTFAATRDQITKGWGTSGLAYCDPVTGMAIARFETYLARSNGNDD
jgi:hypothetical protein